MNPVFPSNSSIISCTCTSSIGILKYLDKRWQVIASQTLLTISQAVERPISINWASVLNSTLVANFQCHSHTLLQGYCLPKACISFYYVMFKFSTQLVKCVLPHSEVLHPILNMPLSLNQSPPMLAPWLTPNFSYNGLIDNYQLEGQKKGKCLLDQKLSHPLLLFQMAYFPYSSLRSFLCLSSGLQIKCCAILFSTLDWEVTLPSLFEFSQMWTEP